MNFYLIIIIISLVFIIIYLVYKIISVTTSLKEIDNKLNIILNNNTNNLITISTNNKLARNIANILNKHLSELRKQKLEYLSGNDEIRKSITDISHDLRTPLTSLKGYTDLIKKEKSSKKQKEYLQIIDERVDKLIELTNQFFDYSKIIDNNNNISKENVCLNDILEETIISYYALFKNNNITPNVNICNNKIYRQLDRNMLIRTIENILSNSIKYTENNINITLSSNGKMSISNKTSKLDRTSIGKIFDRYYTVENSKNNSGLGLSIAKHLVKLNNGTIKAIYKKKILTIEIDFSNEN